MVMYSFCVQVNLVVVVVVVVSVPVVTVAVVRVVTVLVLVVCVVDVLVTVVLVLEVLVLVVLVEVDEVSVCVAVVAVDDDVELAVAVLVVVVVVTVVSVPVDVVMVVVVTDVDVTDVEVTVVTVVVEIVVKVPDVVVVVLVVLSVVVVSLSNPRLHAADDNDVLTRNIDSYPALDGVTTGLSSPHSPRSGVRRVSAPGCEYKNCSAGAASNTLMPSAWVGARTASATATATFGNCEPNSASIDTVYSTSTPTMAPSTFNGACGPSAACASISPPGEAPSLVSATVSPT